MLHPERGYTVCAWFVWESALKGVRALCSRNALFKEGAFTSVPRGSGPASAEAEWSGRCTHGVCSWICWREWRQIYCLFSGFGSPLCGFFPPWERARRSAYLPPRRLILRVSRKSQYEELLEVVTRAVAKLNIDWPAEKQAELQRSKLDERFLRNRPPPSRWSLPFFPDLHTNVSRLWSRPFSARLFIPASDYYGNVEGLTESGYRAMPWVEQMLVSYLSPDMALSLKVLSLPSKPLRTTSVLVGKGYSEAGQAGACLHTKSVLHAYQADLLKELDESDEIKKDDIIELQRTVDLSLCATKETARTIGRSIAAMVAAERHLCLTLSDMKEKDRVFLLNAPLAPSGLFGDAVNSVVDRYQEAWLLGGSSPSRVPAHNTGHLKSRAGAKSGAFKKLLPNVSAWVLHTVERGYRIQCGAPPPPFNGVFPTLVGPKQGLVIEQEVDTLLSKEAIEVVPPHDRESGFYSRYFIVPKKDGGLRPILDLRLLNRSVMWLKFRMLTVSQVVSQIRKFLRFAFRGEAYQYRVLLFGLALSPHTFTKCVDAALASLRLQGIRILNYIDDWLILAQSEQMVVQHRDVVLAHMKKLGLRLNAKKSVLSPLQRTTYLSMVWDLTTMQARLSPAQIELILTSVARLKEGQSFTVKQFQQLLGLMAAAFNVIPFGLLYMRPLQWWLRTKGFSLRGKTILHPRPELWKLWRLFTSWCGHCQQDPVAQLLEFLQERFSARLAYSNPEGLRGGRGHQTRSWRAGVPAEFSSNPNQTHQNQLIKVLLGHRPSRNKFGDPCFNVSKESRGSSGPLCGPFSFRPKPSYTLGMFRRSPPRHHGMLYSRPFVLLPFGNRTSRRIIGLITHDSEHGHTEGVPHSVATQRLVPFGTPWLQT
ncbi:Transposon Ty3-G Gag-Pol polyprotein [Labeo rohita]|uniref:ribonuclease H n=1 Tax=Labeo rohita TaxID=84645 RepID=A0ABQ8L9P9_LABRO|nr:Transposon Ty3-G Gag-Pol polyprotein [Labeo rohita]